MSSIVEPRSISDDKQCHPRGAALVLSGALPPVCPRAVYAGTLACAVLFQHGARAICGQEVPFSMLVYDWVCSFLSVLKCFVCSVGWFIGWVLLLFSEEKILFVCLFGRMVGWSCSGIGGWLAG